jgi:hypothetical protein
VAHLSAVACRYNNMQCDVDVDMCVYVPGACLPLAGCRQVCPTPMTMA